MLQPDPLYPLWQTPLGVHRFAQADEVNEVLVRVLQMMRATDSSAVENKPFYASSDNLMQRIRLSEWDKLVGFIVDSVRETVVLANQGSWPEAKPALQIAIRGIWFQMTNQGSHHDVHTHGNCSWSGVYCLQVDPPERRNAHPVLGMANGVTRFYGPYFNRLGGAAMDFGNAYLQNAHLDIAPIPGQLLVFPSWLAHQAMPYHGSVDRVIVSFNVSIHTTAGSDQLHGYSHV
jgi:uncharacterized protein (TIGR02466 family)